MRLPQKHENLNGFDFWLAVFAGFSLCASAGLVWLSDGKFPLVGAVLVAVFAVLISCSIFIKKIDMVLVYAAQIAVALQLLSAIAFEQRPALFGGILAMAVSPVVVWLALIQSRSFRFFDLAGYILVLAGFFVTVFTPSPQYAIPFRLGDSDLFLMGTVVASIVVGYMLREGIFHRDTILNALGISGSVLVFVVVIQDFFGSDGSILAHRLALSAIIGPNLLAFCLDLSLPITFGISFEQESRIKKNIFFALGVFQLIALIMTGTRGSIITIAAVLIWLVYRAREMKYFWVIMPPIFALILAVIIQKTISRLVSSSPEELLSHLGRLFLMRTAWDMLSQNHFLWGIGVDRFSFLKFEHGFPIWFNPTKSMSTHNTYLEYWLGWGLISVFGYILVLFRALLPRRGNRASEITTGLKIAVSGVIFHGFVDSALVAYSFTFTLWVVLACSIFGEPKRKMPDLKGLDLSLEIQK